MSLLLSAMTNRGNSPEPPPRTAVLGVKVSAVDLPGAASTMMEWIRGRHRGIVTVTGVHGIVEAQDDPVFKGILNAADLCVPDGVPLVWLCRLAGHRNTARVFGPDLMLAMSREMSAEGYKAFYYGGTAGVAEELAREMERRFPGLRTAGVYAPPFGTLTETEKAEVVSTINAAAPHVLWVGLSTPKQERWMAAFRDRLSVPVMVGVGAAFDYNTGRLRRAPRWMQAAALEWLYRLAQEPRRLWRRYARNNPRFVYYLLLERLGLRSFG